MQTAVTLLQRGEALYPFNGLQGFPQNYPMLVTGDAQVRGWWVGSQGGHAVRHAAPLWGCMAGEQQPKPPVLRRPA